MTCRSGSGPRPWALTTAAVLLLSAGCSDSGGVTDPQDEEPDEPTPPSLVKGLALSPMGFPTSFYQIPAFLAEAGAVPEAGVMWNGS